MDANLGRSLVRRSRNRRAAYHIICGFVFAPANRRCPWGIPSLLPGRSHAPTQVIAGRQQRSLWDLRRLRAGSPLPPRTRLCCCRVRFRALRCFGWRSTAPEPKLLGHRGPTLRIFGCYERMFGSQTPASAIFGRTEPVQPHQVTAKRVPAPATFEADDRIALNRAADRDGRGAFSHGFWRSAEVPECLVHFRNQGRQLVCW